MVANRSRLNVPIHSARKFRWSNDFTGSAEVSDFSRTISSRVYTDAADVGFICESPRTGKQVLFTLCEEERHDGELVSETYVSCAFGGWVPDMRIIIFND